MSSMRYSLSLFETHSVRPVSNLLVIGLHGFTGRLQASAGVMEAAVLEWAPLMNPHQL